MTHWQLEQHDEARRWFNKAVESTAADATEDHELYELHEKAADLLNEKP